MTTWRPVANSARGFSSQIASTLLLACLALLATRDHALIQEPAKAEQQPTSCTSEGYLRITVYGVGKQPKTPVSAVLTDPQGRKLGFEPVGNIEFNDIPQATRTRDREQPKAVRK